MKSEPWSRSLLTEQTEATLKASQSLGTRTACLDSLLADELRRQGAHGATPVGSDGDSLPSDISSSIDPEALRQLLTLIRDLGMEVTIRPCR